MWNEIVASYERFVGTGMMIALFLVAVIYLFVVEKNKTTRIILIYVPVILLVVYFCPLFAKVVFVVVGSDIYYRILWLIPIVLVLAYAATKIILSLSGRKKWLAGIAIVVIIMTSGQFVYKSVHFSVADNLYHIPQEVIDLCEAIREEEIVTAAFPPEHLHYVRQYTEDIYMPYGREMLVAAWGSQNSLYNLVVVPVLDVEALVEELRKRETEYVVFSVEKELLGSFEEYQFEFIYETENYIVYRDSLYGR